MGLFVNSPRETVRRRCAAFAYDIAIYEWHSS